MLFNARSWDGFKKQEEKFMEERTIKIKLLAQEAAELQIAGSWEDTGTTLLLSFPKHLLLGTAQAGHWPGLLLPQVPSLTSLSGLMRLLWKDCGIPEHFV